jgi:hypothetical protein
MQQAIRVGQAGGAIMQNPSSVVQQLAYQVYVWSVDEERQVYIRT